MTKLTIHKPGHKFNGAGVILTHGLLDSAYYHRGTEAMRTIERPVPVIILARGNATELMDILDASELIVSAN